MPTDPTRSLLGGERVVSSLLKTWGHVSKVTEFLGGGGGDEHEEIVLHDFFDRLLSAC